MDVARPPRHGYLGEMRFWARESMSWLPVKKGFTSILSL